MPIAAAARQRGVRRALQLDLGTQACRPCVTARARNLCYYPDLGPHPNLTRTLSQVHYYPDLNFMISSSLDGTLKIDGELGRKNATTRTLGEAQTPHSAVKRGVYSFAWSGTSKLLASCGLERTISLWNPYTRNPKPLAVLQGHTASVLHVAINDEGFQLYSCSTDKCIKVWDLRSHKCLQTIHDKTHYRPEDRITAMAFDPIHSRLITGTTKLRPWCAAAVGAQLPQTRPSHLEGQSPADPRRAPLPPPPASTAPGRLAPCPPFVANSPSTHRVPPPRAWPGCGAGH